MSEQNHNKASSNSLGAIPTNLFGIEQGDVGAWEEMKFLESYFLSSRLPTLNKAMEDAGVNEVFDLDRFKFIADHLFQADENATDPILKVGLYDDEVLGLRTDPVNPAYESADKYFGADEIADTLDKVQVNISNVFSIAGESDIEKSPKAKKLFVNALTQSYSDLLRAHPVKSFEGKDKSEMVSLIFIEQFAREFDQTLDLSSISNETLHDINREAIDGNLGRLRTLFSNACKPVNSLDNTNSYSSLFDLGSKMKDIITGKDDAIFHDENGNLRDYLDQRGIKAIEQGPKADRVEAPPINP